MSFNRFLKAGESTEELPNFDLVRLHQTSQKLLEDGLNLQVGLKIILCAFLEMQGTDLGLISLLSENGSLLRTCASVGLEPKALDKVVNADLAAGPFLACMQSGRQLVLDNILLSESLKSFQMPLKPHKLRALHCVPIICSNREVVGVICAFFKNPQSPTQNQHLLSDLYAREAANLITNQQSGDVVHESEETLKGVNQNKDEFLAMLAHELRNPLAALASGIALLDRSSPEEENRQRIQEIMKRQVAQLTHLLDDLLDVSRITRGLINLKRQKVSLHELVDRAMQAVRPEFEKRKHRLTVSSSGRAPCWLEADTARLEQIMVNVLSNAAKYTPEGGKISLRYGRENKEVVIDIRDNGIGIEPEMMPRLFDLFTQDRRGLDRAEGGLGVGLAVAKRLVDLHEGSLKAESEGSNKGARFIIRLPAIDEPDSSVSQEGKGDRREGSAKRILIVDDNQDTATALSMLLQSEGHLTRTVNHANDALAILSEYDPQVALIDIGLPDIDGFELAEKIRREFASSVLTLIAVTGYGQTEDKARSAEAGFEYHLVKPVDIVHLLQLLDRLEEGRLEP